MKKNKNIILISIIILFILIIAIIIIMINKTTSINTKTESIFVDKVNVNNNIAKISKEQIKSNINNVSINMEVGNHMNITLDEVLTYGVQNGELIGYFNEKGYSTLYLYTCTYINNYMYKCPKDGFNDFISQFTSTGRILLVKGKNSYFKKGDNIVEILNNNNYINFVIK